MANIADLSGDEREQRAAELKRKMQEAARRTKAAQEASAPAAAPAPPAAAPAAVAVVEAPAEVATATVGTEVVEPMADDSAESVVVTSEAPVAQNGNGVAAAPAPTAVISAPPRPVAPVAEPVVEDPEAAAKAQMNRREFLTYAWGAALGLLTLQGGVASFLFLYPRFRAGEFGGDFFKPMSEFGDPAAEPNGDTTGKFWMVTTAEGEPKAIYMVCTHLGCLYKWVGANNRFECPCHGSKFSHDGFYIEGPAPRSLDYFDVTVEGDQVVVHTGRKTNGAPAAESPARAAPV
jgi:cytochrome b6-f complex iron-sulfur subunit